MTPAAAQPLPRGRHKLSREQVSGAQRERMLRAMAEAMAERGYADTPVAEIIRRARVSRETFYQQFASKQDCFVAALEETIGQLHRVMTAALGQPGEPIERVGRLIGIYLEALALDPARSRLFLIEIYAAGPDVARRRGQLQDGFVAGLARLFDADDERSLFACRAVMAATIGMATNLVAAGRAEELPTLKAPLVALIRSILLVSATAPHRA